VEEKIDWLVMRDFGSKRDQDEICVLSTRGDLLMRHPKEHVREGVPFNELDLFRPVGGLRRYITESAATRKAKQLNVKHSTLEYKAVRQDLIT
jgi:hypothetical protein